jgi:hypothetical protein
MEESKSKKPSAESVSYVTRLFAAVAREFAEEKPAAYVPSSAEPSTPDADPAAPYIRAASVLVTFEPSTLNPLAAGPLGSAAPVDDDRKRAMQSLFGHSLLVVDAQGTLRCCLRDPVRRAALAELLAADRMVEALEANRQAAFDPTDPVQRMFVAVLGNFFRNPESLKELRLEELTALQQVVPWVEGLNLWLPPAREILRYQERERLLDPVRLLIGRWEKGEYVEQDGRPVWKRGLFVEHFRGRKDELRRLRAYVDVAKSESYAESAQRAVSAAVASLFDLHRSPPLMIHGPGGVGKSTLMAKFLLQHAEAQERERFPFVYIDFDRPDILSVGGDPSEGVTLNLHTLLSEIARQFAVQYPEAELPLTTFLGRLRAESSSRVSVEPESYIAELGHIHGTYVEPDRPVLMVLDTFEEVQQQGRENVYQLFDFLRTFQSSFPRLRVVLAGRAPVTEEEAGLHVHNVALPDLDKEAARGFLQSRGVQNEEVADELIELAGRQPLALKLAADLVRDVGVAEVRESVGGTGLISRLRRAWTQTDVTGRLYHRLLNHIADPEVRQLAHPGLVLRRVTADIIKGVLAEPCGVEVEDDAAARRLFDRLRQQVSLVAPAEPGALRHRPDVRRIMLPLILSDPKKPSREIQERAVAYYEPQEGTAARAEEIYHRLILGQPREVVVRRWTDGLKAHLLTALDELPPPAQAFVAARLDVERPDSVWRVADLEDWELYAERRVRKMLSMKNGAARADRLLKQRPDRSPVSRLYGIAALVYNVHNQGRGAAEDAISRYRKAGVHADLVDELEAMLAAPEGGTQGLFTPDELNQIAAAIKSADLEYSPQLRYGLFATIPPDYFHSIPVAETMPEQLRRDLLHLNLRGLLHDGAHPMVLWLQTAVDLIGNTVQAKPLRKLLAQARRRVLRVENP